MNPLTARFERWLFDPSIYRQQMQADVIHLGQRQVFILPTRYGLGFAVVLLVMFLGATNYNNAMAYFLTFLLTALGFMAIWQTQRNLVQLRLHPEGVRPVFAGETAHFGLRVDNRASRPRSSVAFDLPKRKQPVFAHIEPRAATQVTISVTTQRRGRLALGRLVISSSYPIGLLRAWSVAEPTLTALVYPRPAEQAGQPPRSFSSVASGGFAQGRGVEDFSGIRNYVRGDSPRRIAWKAVARGEQLMTKEFSGMVQEESWLDWAALPATMDVETRLSRLCRWVIDAHAEGREYGLKLPDQTIAPGRDKAHRNRCLEALALFGVSDDDGN